MRHQPVKNVNMGRAILVCPPFFEYHDPIALEWAIAYHLLIPFGIIKVHLCNPNYR